MILIYDYPLHNEYISFTLSNFILAFIISFQNGWESGELLGH